MAAVNVYPSGPSILFSMRATWAWALLLAGITAGCPDRRAEPKAVLRTFLQSLKANDAKGAYRLLSTASQEELQRRQRALAEVTGHAPNLSPAALIHSVDLTTLGSFDTIAQVSRPGATPVRMRVTVKSGRPADIQMVREKEQWRVDLFASLSLVADPSSGPRDDPVHP